MTARRWHFKVRNILHQHFKQCVFNTKYSSVYNLTPERYMNKISYCDVVQSCLLLKVLMAALLLTDRIFLTLLPFILFSPINISWEQNCIIDSEVFSQIYYCDMLFSVAQCSPWTPRSSSNQLWPMTCRYLISIHVSVSSLRTPNLTYCSVV